MIQKPHRTDRRILKFPAVHPCEGISPATLLDSLISLSHTISSYQSKFFPTQKRNAREIIRQISILLIFFEEIQDHVSAFSDSIALSLSELHHTFQKIQFLLEDCSREGARILILMKSHLVTTQFRNLIRGIATALDVLPLNSLRVSVEIKELIELLSRQARKAKMELHLEDEIAMKRVILVLNQFENRFEPDPFMIRRILGHMDIKTWAECQKEIQFLDEEIRVGYSDGDEREIPLLSSLLGLLRYCRAVQFEECDFGFENQSEGRTANLEVLSCLNPEDFRCPISLELMTDPVTVSTGQTYDRISIQKWLKSGNLICPKTGEKLTTTDIVPNTSLKKLIHNFCAEYGISLAKSRKINRDISRTILPGSPSNAEAMRFLSEFLALRLRYGSEIQQNKASYEIRLLAKSNLFNRSCLIEAGCIPPLLDLSNSPNPMIQEKAISALLKLSKQPNGQKSIIENGGLSPILEVLRNGLTLEARQISAAVIFYISSLHEYRKMIGERYETIPSLLELIKEGTPYGKKNSMVALFALLMYHKNRQRVLLCGAVPIFLSILASSDHHKDDLKTDALAVLSTLADIFEGSMELLQCSALSLVLRVLQSIETRAGKEYCVLILLSLCINCGADVIAVLAKDSSLMPALYSLLIEGTSHAGRKARSLIKILQRFCEARSSRSVKDIRQDQSVDVC